VVAVPADAATDMQEYLIYEGHHGGYFVGDDLGGVKMAGVEAEQGVVGDGIAQVIEGFFQTLPRAFSVDGYILIAVGDPRIRYAGRAEGLSHCGTDSSTSDAVFDPELAYCLIGV